MWNVHKAHYKSALLNCALTQVNLIEFEPTGRDRIQIV